MPQWRQVPACCWMCFLRVTWTMLSMRLSVCQERNSERITEQTVDVPVPQDMKGIEIECVAPAPPPPGDGARPRGGARTCRCLRSACSSEEYVAPTPAVSYAVPAPLIEYVASEPAFTNMFLPQCQHVAPVTFSTRAHVSSVAVSALHLRTLPQGP